MASPDHTTPYTKDSEQVTLNQSKDPKYDVLAVELVAENPGGTALDRLKTDADGNLKTTASLSPGSITNDGTFAKETGGNLDTLVTNTSRTVTLYYSAALTSTGTVTPTSGKAIKIKKVLITNSSNNTTFNNVALSSTSLGTFLQGEAIATSMMFTLATNEALTITLATSDKVYVNIQYAEI